MIKIDGHEVVLDHFPDGTLHLKPELKSVEPFQESVTISWHYENDGEMAAILFLTKHLQRLGYDVELFLPYIPNARMDRVKEKSDVFTLKYFAEFINALKFLNVVVLDPHSSVSEALFDNLTVLEPTPYIEQAIKNVCRDNYITNPTIFFPDEGAMKRYSGKINRPYAFGIKRRDWETGNILGLDVCGDTNLIKNKIVLIIDDICSKGGTFLHSAKKLKELGADKIYLFVTHCEFTVFRGELLHGDLIEKLYTTDSIFVKNTQKFAKDIGLMPSKIEVFNL